jgi:putative Mg2+ transporter-C (MgtC) family protein
MDWTEIWNTLRAEFGDLPTAAEAVRIVVRLLVAACLAGILGYEREQQGKSAGIRTHMLVALGAALFVIIPLQMKVSAADLTRVLQGVVAGIGFLGAGTIIKREDEDVVQGLTTAAGIWLTAAIGIAAGAGLALSAILSTLLAMLILTLGPRLSSLLGSSDPQRPENSQRASSNTQAKQKAGDASNAPPA